MAHAVLSKLLVSFSWQAQRKIDASLASAQDCDARTVEPAFIATAVSCLLREGPVGEGSRTHPAKVIPHANMVPELVIFDFDGTLVDSRFAIARTAQVALVAVGEKPVADAQIHMRIGLPLTQIFSEVVPGLDEPRCAAAVAAYRAHYADISRAHTVVFEGMGAILNALRNRGTTMAIATGKSTRGAHASIERQGLDPRLFACVVGTDAVPQPKPHPDMVLHILAELNVAAEQSIVVGDTSFDMQMSASAGVPACGVTWGSHDRHTLLEAGATSVVDSRSELAALLRVETVP